MRIGRLGEGGGLDSSVCCTHTRGRSSVRVSCKRYKKHKGYVCVSGELNGRSTKTAATVAITANKQQQQQ